MTSSPGAGRWLARLRRTVGAGIQVGLLLAGLVAVFALGAALFTRVNIFEHYGMSLTRGLSGYAVTCVVVRAIGGLLAPLARWTAGVTLMGAICTALFGIGMQLTMVGRLTLDRETAFIMGMMVAAGTFLGVFCRAGWRRGAALNRELGGKDFS